MKYLLQRVFVHLPALYVHLPAVLMVPASHAKEAAPAAPTATVRYVELKPTCVTNFGVSDSGHLH
ncbi:MAG: hypothetical protein ACI9UU_000750 [Candidatus Azotimanducaceae bacterium]|jgi:hypothetical protein